MIDYFPAESYIILEIAWFSTRQGSVTVSPRRALVFLGWSTICCCVAVASAAAAGPVVEKKATVAASVRSVVNTRQQVDHGGVPRKGFRRLRCCCFWCRLDEQKPGAEAPFAVAADGVRQLDVGGAGDEVRSRGGEP